MAKIHLATADSFDSGINSSIWSGAGTGVTWVSGHVEIASTSTLRTLYTTTTHDFTSSHFSGEIVLPGGGGGARQNSFRVGDSQTGSVNYARFFRNGANTLTCELVTGGVAVGSHVNLTYDPVTMLFLKIAESAGSITWETGSDGISWTVQKTAPTQSWGSSMTAVYGAIRGFASAAEVPSVILVDNINKIPALSTGPTGISPTSALGDPTLAGTTTVAPAGIASTAELGTPSLARIAHVILSESFPGDSAALGGDLVWQELNQNWSNVGGEATCHGTGAIGFAKCSSDIGSDDYGVLFTITAQPANSSVDVCARMSAGTTSLANATCYVLATESAGGGRFRILSLVGGVSATVVDWTPSPFTLPAQVGFEVVGSKLIVHINGAFIGSWTDTAIPTGPYAGIASWNGVGLIRVADWKITNPTNLDVVRPTGIPRTTGIGTPSVSISALTVHPTGVALNSSPGMPTITSAVSVVPTGITGSPVLGSPSLSTHTTVRPSGVAPTSALGVPVVSSSITAAPAGVARTSTLGSPTLASQTTVAPSGRASTAAMGSPVIAPGAANALAAGIAPTHVAGVPAVTGTTPVAPAGVPTHVAVGTPHVSGSTTTRPAGVAPVGAVGAVVVTGTTTVSPPGPHTTQVGTPVLRHIRTVRPVGVPPRASVGMPRLTAETHVVPTGIASTLTFGAPVLKRVWRVRPSGIAGSSTAGTPAISATTTVRAGGLRLIPRLGQPSIRAGIVVVTPAGIAGSPAPGTPTTAHRTTVNPDSERIHLMALTQRIMDV